jgi:hypothetical protein
MHTYVSVYFLEQRSKGRWVTHPAYTQLSRLQAERGQALLTKMSTCEVRIAAHPRKRVLEVRAS